MIYNATKGTNNGFLYDESTHTEDKGKIWFYKNTNSSCYTIVTIKTN
jgi:hypothetical protein